jgi:hypothetical protein
MHQAVSVVFHICLFLFSWSSTIEMLRMDCWKRYCRMERLDMKTGFLEVTFLFIKTCQLPQMEF